MPAREKRRPTTPIFAMEVMAEGAKRPMLVKMQGKDAEDIEDSWSATQDKSYAQGPKVSWNISGIAFCGLVNDQRGIHPIMRERMVKRLKTRTAISRKPSHLGHRWWR